MSADPHIDANAAPPEYDEADEPHYQALERTGFFGDQAAGAVLLAADTGRMMLVERSDKVLQPGTWGGLGGAHHADESPEDTTLREIVEESGWTGGVLALVPVLVFSKPGFTYRNFVAVVAREFEPSLGWEANAHRWCTTADLPAPLHFGIEALLADASSLDAIQGGWRKHLG